MSKLAILRRLREGPATAAELAEIAGEHSGCIARTCAELRHDGRIDRIDGRRGRGTKALYALPPRCVNAHDRCYGGAGGPCPYCERPGT